jgi:hypothetical protein
MTMREPHILTLALFYLKEHIRYIEKRVICGLIIQRESSARDIADHTQLSITIYLGISFVELLIIYIITVHEPNA